MLGKTSKLFTSFPSPITGSFLYLTTLSIFNLQMNIRSFRQDLQKSCLLNPSLLKNCVPSCPSSNRSPCVVRKVCMLFVLPGRGTCLHQCSSFWLIGASKKNPYTQGNPSSTNWSPIQHTAPELQNLIGCTQFLMAHQFPYHKLVCHLSLQKVSTTSR